MRKDRLLKLADFLETVPADRFVMADFHANETFQPCGFSGCAMGWAAVSKQFDGLGWDRENNQITYGDVSGGFAAARALFEIDNQQDEELFGAVYGNETPSEVSARIRNFVATDGKIPERE
jgi:hypothetical protein